MYAIGLGVISCAMLTSVFKGDLDDTHWFSSVLYISMAFFVLTLLPQLLSINRNIRNSVKWIYSSVVVVLFFIVSFSQPDIFVEKVARFAGLGNAPSCFLLKDFVSLGLPSFFKQDTSEPNVILLDIVAKIDNTYYIKKDMGNGIEKRVRVVSDSLKQITCPDKK